MLPEPLFLNVHMYGIMVALGILVCYGVIFAYGKKIGLTEKLTDFIFYTSVAAIVFGFISASLFQSLYDYIEDPSKGFTFGNGITFIGGLIGGAGLFLIVYALYRKKLDQKLSFALSTLACAITVAHGFGRIGCFFAGCCYGKETDCFLGIKFPGMHSPVHPTQLYEALFLFILFGVLSYMTLKHNSRYGFALYMVAYGLFRFFIEYLRDDHRGALIAGISPSQFWSIIMTLGGIIMFAVIKYKKPQADNAEDAPQADKEQKD